MYIHVDHRWFKTILNKIIKILICFCLVYTPFFANAGAAEKWEIVENVYDTSKNTVNVTAKKVTQQASNSSVYKVQVPVSASALGSTVKSMMWTGALVASVQALLSGIGWVIDVGSKTIKRPKVDPNDPPPNGYLYLYGYLPIAINPCYCKTPGEAARSVSLASSDSAKHIYKGLVSKGNFNYAVVFDIEYTNGTKQIGIQRDLQKKVDPNPQSQEPEYEIMTDTQLGNELTGKGENKTPAPDIITQAYSPNNPLAEEPAPKATNDALNSANPQPEKEPEGKSETEKEKDENGQETGKETTKFELPKFCDWAPAVCDFFTVQKQDNKEIKENQKEDIAQNKTFFEKVSDWFDWSKENDDLDNDNDIPQVKDIPIGTLDTSTFKGTAGCPAPIPVPVAFAKSGTLEISYEPICAMASKWSFVAPFIGFFSGALIILGVGRKGEDSDT